MDAPIILRTSERKDFKRCPQRWWWSWRQGLRSNQPPSNPLWFGTGIHYALAEYYIPGRKRGPHPVKTWLEWSDGEVRTFREQYGETYDTAEYVDMRELGEAMLTGYVDKYQGDPSWEILAPEHSDQVLVRRLYNDGTATYGFTLDGVYRDHEDGLVKLLETKTAASISVRHLSLEPQAKTYLAFAQPGLRNSGLIGPNEEIKEITYNFLRKAKPTEHPRNAQGHVTNLPKKSHFVEALTKAGASATEKLSLQILQDMAEQRELKVLGEPKKLQPPDNFLRHPERITPEQLNNQISAIEDEVFVMDMIRAEEIPLWKVQVDMGPTACTGCPYFNMCELHDMGGDWEEYRDYAYHREDPYADHRERK
jgi:hypothetical protein